MSKTTANLDLLLHPARIRIVNAFGGGARLTTAELCARLPDVSQASVYRHVALLVAAAVLEVADEQVVRGAVERRYELNRGNASIGSKDAAAMTLDDHRRAITASVAALLADFGAYLDSGEARPTDDRVGYRQIPLWLNEDEVGQLLGRLRRVVAPVFSNGPGEGRRRYLLSPILFPVVEYERANRARG